MEQRAEGEARREGLLLHAVVLQPGATSQQINVVRAKLDSDSRVKSGEFIPKARALELMRERQPEMVRDLVSSLYGTASPSLRLG